MTTYVAEGVMTAPCPVCNSTRVARRFVARDAHYGNEGSWRERECADCGSFSLDPLPSQDELSRYYPEETYYSFRIREKSPFRQRIERWLGVTLQTRDPAFARPGRVLDFGCGAGEFLLRMRAQGWECHGVEVNDAAIRAAREMGFDVRPSISGADGFPDGYFDYVRANHALEHIVDPATTLREMRRVLRPGGTLFIGVPTRDGMNARLFGRYWWYLGAPVHPVTFSTRGLIELVERSGFRVRRVSTNSDYGSFAGSLQIFLNRRSRRRSSEGVIFAFRPLLLLGHWFAKLQDVLGVGDKLELIAVEAAD